MRIPLRRYSDASLALADRQITPYPGNPRLYDDAVASVAASIQEFGFRQPIVVDADGVIICGHTGGRRPSNSPFKKWRFTFAQCGPRWSYWTGQAPV
jgi:hypothetical protein